MSITKVYELHAIRDENSRIKKLVVDLTLSKNILLEILSKKLSPA